MKRTLLGYVPEKSIVYNFHPFTRLFVVFLLTFVPLLILNPAFNGALIVLTVIFFAVSRIDLKIFRYYLPVFVLLFVFITAIYTFFAEEEMMTEALLSVGGVTLYRPAINYALKVYLRILGVLFLTIYFLHVMTESEIVVALRSVKVPFVISYTLGLSLRAIGMFLEDYRTVREAEKARALDISEMNIFKKAAKLINYIVPLLALAIRRTDEFSDAISSRAFSLKTMKNRPNYLARKNRFKWTDFAGICLAVLAIAAVFYLHHRIP